MGIGKVVAAVTLGAVAGAAAFVGLSAASGGGINMEKVGNYTSTSKKPPTVKFKLAPSNDQIAKCLPKVKVDIKVTLVTDAKGFDIFDVSVTNGPKNTPFTVFILQTAAAPFNDAEYIGDVTTDKYGNGKNEFKLIVEEAFTSRVVNGKTVTNTDMNQVGMWFADPKDDDFCFGPGGGPVTTFDGDLDAGAQAFNSAKLKHAPLP